MDNRGGCCIARYGGGGYDISTVDRIMMKFRPIAPKPANGSSGSSPEVSETSPRSSGRGKRRLSSSSSNGSGNKRCNNGTNNRKRKALNGDATDVVVTLPLLPETPDSKDSPGRKSLAGAISPRQTNNLPIWLSFGSNGNGRDEMVISGELDRKVVMPCEVIGSCVTVECITDTWMDVDGLGCTDRERRMNLERDNCPGFVSDGYGRVTWTNEAYKKMVREEGRGGEVVVWLEMKDKVTVTAALASSKAFTCRVRVQNQKSGACGNGKEKSSVITLPCDVWRMDSGGFAWRLDVTAALSLGR